MSMNIEQERAGFEAWLRVKPCGAAHDFAWEAWQARAALQSQPMPPEISRGLLGKIVDEVFDGAIEDASVIEDIYRVVARDCALQSQDRGEWMREFIKLLDEFGEESAYFALPCVTDRSCLDKIRAEIIDHARRAEGDGDAI